ncbi:MAG TPA: site-specific integrase [Phycisphaerae bacterium]|nr:site-specific integrase [Phycisphaerae bacterium]HRW54686.1 site-specific integrase [Phycisphaerae bacterium]
MAPEGWNPCKHAAVVIRSKKPNQIRLLTDNERDAIFEACRAMDDSDWWTAFVDMAIYGGLRAAEIENLCFEDIDFSNHEIRIRPKQHTASTLAWRPKTDAGQRTIPLLPASTFARLRVLKSRAPEGHSYLFLAPQRLAALLAMRDENDKSQARIDDRETLIPTERRQFSRTLLPKANTIMRNQHGSDGATLMQDGKPTVGLHDLRRFAISRWLVNGMEMHEACEFAGHTDIGVMYAHYASILPGRFDKARGIAETIAQADSTPVIGRIGAKPSATSVA